LIVDEHQDSRIGLQEHLAAWQVVSETAASSDEALSRLSSAAQLGKPYDAAIIDMELTHGSGLLLAATIKADPATRATRLLLLSPDRLAADPVQRREAGVAYQLIKPARAADLFECLSTRPRGATAPAPQFVPPPELPRPIARGRVRRVLLAEDNPVNVEVAMAMLESLGLAAECARNGDEALQKVRRGEYDAVLMDCQMPVMDGYAATRALREQPSLKELPVIAMTANAMVGDREAAIAAGMNDHIAKPIKVDDMFATLAKWIKPGRPATVNDASPVDALPASGSIDTHCGLANVGGNEVLYRRVLSLFGEREADFPQRFKAARLAGDTEAATRAAHDLKGLAGTLGMHALQVAAAALERGCLTGAGDADIEDALEQTIGLLGDVMDALKAMEGRPTPAA
jgi:CheY-like chemotaxis protein